MNKLQNLKENLFSLDPWLYEDTNIEFKCEKFLNKPLGKSKYMQRFYAKQFHDFSSYQNIAVFLKKMFQYMGEYPSISFSNFYIPLCSIPNPKIRIKKSWFNIQLTEKYFSLTLYRNNKMVDLKFLEKSPYVKNVEIGENEIKVFFKV